MLAILALAPASAQTLSLEVIADRAADPAGFVVAADWLGVPQEAVLSLEADGDRPESAALHFRGQLAGDSVRLLAVHLYAVDEAGSRTELAASLEPLGTENDAFAWAVEAGPPVRARRVAPALPARAADVANASSVAASLGWVAAVLVYVGWLVRRWEERS